MNKKKQLNAFVSNSPFLYPLKTLENLKVFWCFQEVEKGELGINGLKSPKMLYCHIQKDEWLSKWNPFSVTETGFEIPKIFVKKLTYLGTTL